MLRFLVRGGVGLAMVLMAFAVPAAAAAAGPTHIIYASDVCDPPTFNAPPPIGVGPGTCVRTGRGTTFPNFIQQLLTLRQAPQWRFAQPQVAATSNDLIGVTNIGGEVHTFTEVDQFGGGSVPQINQLLGLTEAPECAAGPGPDNHTLAPGASFTFT